MKEKITKKEIWLTVVILALTAVITSGITSLTMISAYKKQQSNAPVVPGPDVQEKNTTDIIIDSNTFPDAVFMRYITENFDLDKDGALSTKEIMNVPKIKVDGMGIESLKGIEVFSVLLELDCSNNNLTRLNLSQNRKLQALVCDGNYLDELILMELPQLIEINCSKNHLAKLDITQCRALLQVRCDNNNLAQLDVSQNARLNYLDCTNNTIRTVDVSKNSRLKVYSVDRTVTVITPEDIAE